MLLSVRSEPSPYRLREDNHLPVYVHLHEIVRGTGLLDDAQFPKEVGWTGNMVRATVTSYSRRFGCPSSGEIFEFLKARSLLVRGQLNWTLSEQSVWAANRHSDASNILTLTGGGPTLLQQAHFSVSLSRGTWPPSNHQGKLERLWSVFAIVHR
jgi:hypothetical protein